MKFNRLRLNEPYFILIMGSAGSGKNYIAKKEFPGIPLVDIDKYMSDLAGTDGDTRKFISKSIIMANNELLNHFKEGSSVVQVTTGANYKGASNKLKLAKSYGMKTAVIFVDAGLKKSLERQRKRAENGEQRLVPDWKVEKTYEKSKENWKLLSKEADFSQKIRN